MLGLRQIGCAPRFAGWYDRRYSVGGRNPVFRLERREFITLLGGAAAAWPLAGRAEQALKVARIGYLSPAVGRNANQDAFEGTLQQLGWVKGHNIAIESRHSRGRQDTVAPLVAEIVGLGVDVIVAWGPPLSLAVKRATTQIPLVFILTFDPVDIGLVSNLARPGGNVTGITSLASLEIFAKRLQLLKEVVPSLSRVAVLVSTEQTRSERAKEALQAAAKALNVELADIEVRVPADLEDAISKGRQHGAQAVYAWPSGFTFSFARQISDTATANRLPSVHSFREGALAGGLLAYAADIKEEARRGAAYVDKILRGAAPGDLPVEQMSKYELLINLKTATALGLTVPPTLLATADEVIE
jgi:putative ABC transport system substrate-binding protein